MARKRGCVRHFACMWAERMALFNWQDVEMQVKDGLACRWFVVLAELNTVTVERPHCGVSDPLNYDHHASKNSRICVEKIATAMLGHNQAMPIDLRHYIKEGKRVVVFANFVTGYLAADDFGEYVVGIISQCAIPVLGGRARVLKAPTVVFQRLPAHAQGNHQLHAAVRHVSKNAGFSF
jgi:hypothetical protein